MSLGEARESVATRPLLLTTTLLAFFTSLFLTSMIKTCAVVPRPPQVYRSYRDLLDADATPIWVREAGDAVAFRDAVPGSEEREIWDHAASRGLQQSFLSPDDAHLPMKALDAMISIGYRRSVGLTSRLVTRLAVSNMCAYMRSNGLFPDTFPFVTADSRVRQFLRVAVGAAHVADGVRRYIVRRIMPLIETQSFEHLVLQQFKAFLTKGVRETSKTGSIAAAIEECEGNVVRSSESRSPAGVQVAYLHSLFLMLLVSAGIASSILLAEVASGARLRR